MDIPKPNKGQSLIKVFASGVNPVKKKKNKKKKNFEKKKKKF